MLLVRLETFGLSLAPEKTAMMPFSRFHPSMCRRIVFLGFETCWTHDKEGKVRVMQCAARKKLQGACRRIKEWVKENRHLKGGRVHKGAQPQTERTLQLLQRGGKRKSFTSKVFHRAIDRLGIANRSCRPPQRYGRCFADADALRESECNRGSGCVM